MKDRASRGKVELLLTNLLKGGHILHDQYNTRHAVPAIPDEIRGEIRREPSKSKVQQKPVIYLLLAGPLGWQCGVPGLRSRRPHSHHNQHTEAELKLIRDMRRKNPTLGMVELWHRLKQRGYTRRPERLFRVMRKLGMFPPKSPKTLTNQSPTSK